MLYLIEQYGDEGRKYLKIGSSGDIDKRIKQYSTHCAEYKVLDTFQGTEQQEHMLQKLLIKYVFRNEFMTYNENIIETWNVYKVLYEYLTQIYNKKLKEKEDKIEKLEEKNNSLTKQIEKYKNVIEYYKELNKKLQENIDK